MLLPILAILVSPVQAGELHIHAPSTMLVKIEGIVRDFDAGTSVVVVGDLATASYQVEIANAFGKLKAQELVHVDQDELVTLTYAKRALVETARTALAQPAAPAPKQDAGSVPPSD